MRYLSIDCGHRTFAWCVIELDYSAIIDARNMMRDIREFIKNAPVGVAISDNYYDKLDYLLAKLLQRIQEFIILIDCNVDDIVGDKLAKFTEVEQARSLRRFLTTHKVLNDAALRAVGVNTVFIERQPPQLPGMKHNRKSTAVANQLAFYYGDFEVISVSSGLKNKMTLCCLENDTYSGRKKHSVDTLRMLALLMGFENKINHLPKNILHNLADAFIQAIAFLMCSLKK